MKTGSYCPVTLWLLPMLILSSVGPSGNNEAKKSPDFDITWSWQNSAKKDQNEGRDQQSLEPRFHPHKPDINTLFKQLDDLERMDTENPNVSPYPSSSQANIHSESFPVGAQSHSFEQDKYHEILKPFNLGVMPVGPQSYLLEQDEYNEFVKPLNLDVMNAAGVGKGDQITSFQRDNDWEEKPSEIQANPPSGTPKTMTGYTPITTRSPTKKTTAVIRPSTYCLSEPTPFRPATAKSPDPTTSTTIQTTLKPSPTPRPSSPPMPSTTSIPITSKVPSVPKIRKKSKHLSAKTAKIILDSITITKQHVLSVLKTLNYLEMEVLSQSPEDCPLQKFEKPQPKKNWVKPQKPQKPFSSKHSQTFFFGIRPASQLEGDSVMALAKEEELKLKSRVWEEYQQQMRDMLPSKSRRFKMTPKAGVRHRALRELKGPQEPLKRRNPLKYLPSKDTSAYETSWNDAG